jgi:hypothetical protein
MKKISVFAGLGGLLAFLFHWLDNGPLFLALLAGMVMALAIPPAVDLLLDEAGE